MYWIYRTHIMTWRNQYVQAKLVSPPVKSLRERYGKYGYRGGLQDEPYGIDMDLTFRVDPRHPQPDNYFQSASFTLHSERLVNLMSSFNVKAEVFPVKLIDKKGQPLPDLRYYIFHSLEGVLEAMDEEQSGWTDNHDIGISQLALDYEAFEHRPIFKCNHIFVPLMRDDVKSAIQDLDMVGFEFLEPQGFRTGAFGSPTDFNR